jgi:hypothetical protein
MLFKPLTPDYWKSIKGKSEFLEGLMKEGLDPVWMFKAIRHQTRPPYECNEVFFEVPLIEQLKRTKPEKAKEIVNAIRNLSALLNNPIIQEEEKKALSYFQERITKEYDLDHPMRDYKALLDSFRSETDLKNVEDYSDYSEHSVGWEIDARLRTEEQCEGKLFDMLLRYIGKYTAFINEKMPLGHEKDYTQRDIFDLIAEILNLRKPDMYDYEKVRTSYGNFFKVSE